MPFEHRNNPIIIEPIQCENMFKFELADERGIIFNSITINGLIKIRSLKKMLKYQCWKERE
jgi:hypothetical protein